MTKLYYNPFIPAFSNIGVPVAQARLYFYYTQTNTLAPIYSDAGATIPLSNPVSANLAGKFPDIYLDSNIIYRVKQTDALGVLLGDEVDPYYPGTAVFAGDPGLRSDLASTASGKGASLLGFKNSAAGSAAATVAAKLSQTVSVLDFGADPTGATDSSTAFTAAAATGKRIYVPAGTYKVNMTAPSGMNMYGDGTTKSIIKPNSTTSPCITFKSDLFWTYARSLTDLGFTSTGKTGIGVAFGCGNPANYVTNDEFAQSVVLTRCRFIGFDKGVVAGAGNLGIEFYSCNFATNKYGCYFVDSKFGGVMHAGCKYFFGGEFDYNDVGIYIHNRTDQCGGIEFNGTIIESNAINMYCFNDKSMHIPIIFRGVWGEGSGTLTGTANVTLDQWTGTTLTTTSFASRAWIFDGDKIEVIFDSGFVTDINLIATSSNIIVNNSRFEQDAGFGGKPCTVAATSSSITLYKPITDGGIGFANRVVVVDYPINHSFNITNIETTRKQFLTVPRFNKQTSYGGSGTFQPFTTAQSLAGLGGIAGSVVSDGVIYSSCNEFVCPFSAPGQFLSLNGTGGNVASTTANWYVVTFDIKSVSGDAVFHYGNLADSQLMAAAKPVGDGWNTFAAIGLAPAGKAWNFTLTSPTGVASTIRVSALQVRAFTTRIEAQAYLDSKIYVGA